MNELTTEDLECLDKLKGRVIKDICPVKGNIEITTHDGIKVVIAIWGPDFFIQEQVCQ
tara:strand:- start:58553 stop:58726 length:174 start_codon:yes stop_codon:yes gene_type:complete